MLLAAHLLFCCFLSKNHEQLVLSPETSLSILGIWKIFPYIEMGVDQAMSQQTVNPDMLRQMGRFRQKVIQLAVVERKSVYETAIACGCSAEKVKRVLKKWRVLSKGGVLPAPKKP